MVGLDLHATLVLLVHPLCNGGDELVCDQIHMGATLGGVDAVDEGDLLKVTVGKGDADVPPLIALLADLHSIWPPSEVQINVIAKIPDPQRRPVQMHLAPLVSGPSHVENPFGHQIYHVGGEAHHAEFSEIRPESDACVVRSPVLLDLRGVLGLHVVFEHLTELAPRLRVSRLHDEAGGKNVGELCSVTVPSTRHLLLTVVVIVRGEEVAKNQLWDVDPVLLVHLNRNATTIVPHTDETGCPVDIHLHRVHGVVPLEIVSSIHKDLVKNFEQRRDPVDFSLGHAALGGVPDPEGVRGGLHAADIGVGAQ
mmetsp:Transcript_4676/g.10344  ORF Transcript_4676/g.10344 Transcript_4676/m.10344 type:complete len:309 (-) Transcript_4676:95-1021(-)